MYSGRISPSLRHFKNNSKKINTNSWDKVDWNNFIGNLTSARVFLLGMSSVIIQGILFAFKRTFAIVKFTNK